MSDTFTVFYRIQCALFYIENDVEIFPVHCTWKVVEKRFKIAFMMNKLTMIISFEINLEELFFQKSLQNSGAHYTCMSIILDQIQQF